MFGIVVLSNAWAALSTWMMLTYALKNNHRLSQRLLEKYLGMPYVYFIDQNSTDLGNNVLNEVNQLTYRFILPLLTVITKGLVAVFILVLFFWIDVWIALTALLVFDEATSALDGATEEAVLTALHNAARYKTLIIIAHRLATVRDCDRIHVLEKGKIAGEGTFEELMETNAAFKALSKKRL